MSRRLPRPGFTLIELLIVLAIIGLLAAIAVPNFIRFHAKAKQSEARSNSRMMFSSEKAFFGATDRFSTLITEVGFAPERNNRYAYFLAATVNQEVRSGITPTSSGLVTSIGVDTFKGYGAIASPGTLGCGTALTDLPAGSTSWTGAAAGNLDSDTTLDQWTISSDSRTLSGVGCDATGTIAGGEPANEQNDASR